MTRITTTPISRRAADRKPESLIFRQAMGMARGREAGAAYLRAFVEEMKASGFVADALKRSNQPDAVVAPVVR